MGALSTQNGFNSPKSNRVMRGPAHKHLSKMLNQGVASAPSIPTRYECILNTEKRDSDGFGSRTDRFETKKHDVAGPGAYFNFDDRDFAKTSPSLSKKGYGSVISKDKRFFQANTPTFNPPGPGGYEVESSFKRINAKWSEKYIGPSSNFVKPSTKSISSLQSNPSVLGPGYYETIHTPNYSTLYKEKPMSMFTSKTERGVSLSKSANIHPSQVKSNKMTTSNELEELPTSASNAESPKAIHKDTMLPSSVFRSGTVRGIVPKEGVGPGFYNPPIQTDIQRGKPKPLSVFANKDKLDRFGNPIVRYTRKHDVPAPGSYDIPSSFKALNEDFGLEDPTIPKSSVFMSSTKRFSQPSSSLPAPGQYEGAQKASWTKKSFKIMKKNSWNP